MIRPAYRSFPLRRRTLAALVVALVLPNAARAVALQAPPSPVRVDAVREELVQEKRRVTGNVRAVRRAKVATQEAGLVLELLVREGAHVKTGEVLARLDAKRLQLELAVLASQELVSQALLAERQRDLERAQRDLDSLTRLAEREAANPKELDDARTSVSTSQARLEWARQDIEVTGARRKLLEDRIGDMEVKAPFAGTVVALRTEVGEWLVAGAAAVELVSSDELEVWLDVPQRDYAAVRAQPGSIRIVADATGEPLVAESYRWIEEIDLEARTFRVIAPVPANAALAAGMSVTAEVPTAASGRHLTVANDAILRNEVGPYVYAAVPGADGKSQQAVPMPVEVLFRTKERAVVRSQALHAGMDVVVEGNERLYPTAPIQPARPAENDTPKPAPANGSAPSGEKGAER